MISYNITNIKNKKYMSPLEVFALTYISNPASQNIFEQNEGDTKVLSICTLKNRMLI